MTRQKQVQEVKPVMKGRRTAAFSENQRSDRSRMGQRRKMKKRQKKNGRNKSFGDCIHTNYGNNNN